MNSKSLLGVFIGLALIAGLSTVLPLVLLNESSTLSVTEVEKSIPDYQVNEQGQTFGHGPFPAGPEKEPDLFLKQKAKMVL